MFNPLGLLRAQIAEAHCDIPCGIYDPIAAKIAAQTVQKMVLADSGAGEARLRCGRCHNP